MKTAISVPDETYQRASARAHDLGISRSEFFATAAQRYLDDLDAESLTRQINMALDHLGSVDDATEDVVDANRRRLGSEAEW